MIFAQPQTRFTRLTSMIKKTLTILLFVSTLCNFSFAQDLRKLPAKQYQPTVLVELFSSEGCSSCPFADEFTSEIIHISDSSKTPVYVIDYHVDIWNRSGWVDPFSDSTYTLRQQEYVYRKKLTSMFTPMIFVNGSDKEYAGGDKRSVGKAIQTELTRPSNNYLSTGATGVPNEDSIMVKYHVWGPTDSLMIMVALVQRQINSLVKGGENSGLTLHHHNVVRQLKSYPVTGEEGFVKFPVNHQLDLTNFRLVVFLQHQRTWKVVATDQLNFSEQ